MSRSVLFSGILAQILSSTSARFWRWLAVVVLLTLTTAIGFWMDPYVFLSTHVMLYVLAVVIAAYWLDHAQSLACAVWGELCLIYFFVPPRLALHIEQPEHMIALGVMLVVALVISQLSSGLHSQVLLARQHERRARQLQRLATELAMCETHQEIRLLVQRQLDDFHSGPNHLVFKETFEPMASEEPALEASVRDGLRHCMDTGALIGAGTHRWPQLDAWFVPLALSPTQVLGAAYVYPASPEDLHGREHVQAIAMLAAQALYRLETKRNMLATQALAQHQQMQNTFLASISHDLRTPLSVIVGATSALLSQSSKLSASARDSLLRSIAQESEYLSTVTENTLQLARLGQSADKAHMGWESLEEIVGAATSRIPREQSDRIEVQLPGGLPLVKGDPVLLTQLLVNLLDNALKYSVHQVVVQACVVDEIVQLRVTDMGQGVAEAQRERIFDPYVRADRTGQRGAGLGLALCKAVAQVHGGELVHRPGESGGSCFSLSLPLLASPDGPLEMEST